MRSASVSGRDGLALHSHPNVKSLLDVPTFYNIFFSSSVLKRVLSAAEHRGGGEKTTGKNSACVCVHSHSQRLNVRWLWDILLIPWKHSIWMGWLTVCPCKVPRTIADLSKRCIFKMILLQRLLRCLSLIMISFKNNLHIFASSENFWKFPCMYFTSLNSCPYLPVLTHTCDSHSPVEHWVSGSQHSGPKQKKKMV